MNSSDSFVAIVGITVALLCFAAILLQYIHNNRILKEFERKMNNRVFAKRIVVTDLLGKTTNDNWYTVGIWLDYNNKLMALRLNRNSTDLIDIPFDNIRSVEIIEDGYLTTSKGLQVRIVTGGNNGTHPYILKLWEPNFLGAKYNKSDPVYKAIKECARQIVDECENDRYL